MPGSAFEWRPFIVPLAAIRDPDGDGLELKIESRTVPEIGYGNFAKAQLTTVAAGAAVRHENVLLGTNEPSEIADLVARALNDGDLDRTISIFEDSMTMRIERDGVDRWSVTCRPIPMPPPDAKWNGFPAFAFQVHRPSLERARQQLSELARILREGDSP